MGNKGWDFSPSGTLKTTILCQMASQPLAFSLLVPYSAGLSIETLLHSLET